MCWELRPGRLIISVLLFLSGAIVAENPPVIGQSVTYTSSRVQTYTVNVTRTQTTLFSSDSVYLIGFHSSSCYYYQVDLGSGLAGTRLTGTISTQGGDVTLFILNSAQWSPLPVASRMCGDFFAGQYTVKGLSQEGRPYNLDWVFPDNDQYWFVIFDSYNDSQLSIYLDTIKVGPIGVVTYSTSYVLLISTIPKSNLLSTEGSMTGSLTSESMRITASTVIVAAALIALLLYTRRRRP